jgi:hypothetical protein
MSKVIADMLDQSEQAVRKVINKLEDKNGYPSHDVRLVAENIQKARLKIAELGLDPGDTTAQELYHTLQTKFQADSDQFDKHYQRFDDADARLALAVDLVTKNIDLPQRWSLKTAAAKSLLRQNPPKHIMKRLNYRSAESMLKREALSEIYLAAAYLEPQAWQKAHNRLVSQLDSTAFEMRPLHLAALSSKRWGILETDSFFGFDAENGALALIPSDELNRAPLLSMTVLLIDGVSNFQDLKISRQAAKISLSAAWWQDMDSLVANLGGQQISMNIKDCALSHLYASEFEDRHMDASRQSFWRELFNRYENQLPAEENLQTLFDNGLKTLRAPINQPAFEYVEDI